MVKERAQAFVVQGDSVMFNYRGQIAEMALRNRLPAASVQRELAEAGFFLSYGADLRDLYRRSHFSSTGFLGVRSLPTCRSNNRPSTNL